MPRAKRNKVVALTKVTKRNTRDAKSSHMESIREAASQYPTCVVFAITNMRNNHLKEVRGLWKENSKLFFGKNRVVAKAIGEDEESEMRPGLGGVAKKLAGPVGLLFTQSTASEVVEWCSDYARDDFARSGNVASKDVLLEEGPVEMYSEPPETLSAPMEPQLRKLGMPTELRRGVPTLLQPYTVAKKGQKLSTENAQILKHLMIKDAKFRLIPIAHWSESTEKVVDFVLTQEETSLLSHLQREGEGEGKRNDKRGRKGGKRSNTTTVDGEDEMVEDEQDEEEDEEEDVDVEFDNGDRVGEEMMLPTGVAL